MMKMKFPLILLLLVNLVIESHSSKTLSLLINNMLQKVRKSDERIVGGVEATPGRFDYMVSLTTLGCDGHFCGGSLIAPDWVLSAAHCAYYGTHVAIGRHDFTDEEEEYELIEVEYEVVHEDFDYWTLDNDVMLVKLKEDSAHTPIKLDDGGDEAISAGGADVTVIGWGTQEYGAGACRLSDVLMEVEVDVVTSNDCNDAYGSDYSYGEPITDSMICAAREGKDSCQGDSGGPLFKKGSNAEEDIQVGIVSWGNGCASPFYPGVYAKVSDLYEWIIENQNTPAPTVSQTPTITPTPCPDDKNSTLSVQIRTHSNPETISWSLGNGNGTIIDSVEAGEYEEADTIYTHDTCVGTGGCYSFNMTDTDFSWNFATSYLRVYLHGEIKISLSGGLPGYLETEFCD